jgi:UTP-glucose-1-phosphate uridylyltransferase
MEKPPLGTSSSNLVVFGRYVVTAAVIAGLRAARAPAELELTYGFAALVESDPGVRAVRFKGQIFDCGTPADYAASVASFPA